jgi:hypothetical protein
MKKTAMTSGEYISEGQYPRETILEKCRRPGLLIFDKETSLRNKLFVEITTPRRECSGANVAPRM